MKKKIIGGIAVLAVTAVAVWNVNLSSNEKSNLSSISLANVEALAQVVPESQLPKKNKYSSTDLACFDSKGNPTGKRSRSCFTPGNSDSCTPQSCK